MYHKDLTFVHRILILYRKMSKHLYTPYFYKYIYYVIIIIFLTICKTNKDLNTVSSQAFIFSTYSNNN